jgi:hypothetical protein
MAIGERVSPVDAPQVDRSRTTAFIALGLCLGLAWINFLTTGRWASQPGALHGWRAPYYAAALAIASVLLVRSRATLGRPAALGRIALVLCVMGFGVLLASFFCRLPPSTWDQIPFKDDWTELFVQAANGVSLLKRGVMVGWNWHFLGGYPTSTDIAQNFSLAAFLPMALLGDRVGYHVYHLALFLIVPLVAWWDLRHEGREAGWVTGGFAALFAAGYLSTIGSSGDTNSLTGAVCASLALAGSRAAGLGRRWGAPLELAGLTFALITHPAFFVYAGIYLLLEAAWFRDAAALVRLVVVTALSFVAGLPTHWESLAYPGYVSYNNVAYDTSAPFVWATALRNVYYSVEILFLPHRWFNDYRSLANVWLPALVFVAWAAGRTRAGFYAAAAVLTQALLRINTPSLGAGFDRIQHMFPLLLAPALAWTVLQLSGGRSLAVAMVAAIGLYVQTVWTPIRHVDALRDFDPPLIDRVTSPAEGLTLVEISPHRDMDSSPTRRSPTTPFDVHWEGLLQNTRDQRFYTQMIDGWVFSRWRGQVVGAGAFRGRQIGLTPAADFVAEMRKWGVGRLFVWTDETRDYLSRSGSFVERWRGGRWSEFELPAADVRSVVTETGSGVLRGLDPLGAEIALDGVRAGDPVVVRANYYPAWRAGVDGASLPLYAVDGQLAFRAPRDGTYIVRLEYPRYRGLTTIALIAFLGGAVLLYAWPRPAQAHLGAVR